MKDNNKKKTSPLQFATSLVIIICFIFMIVAFLRFGVKNFLIDSGKFDSESLQKMTDFVYKDSPGAEVPRINRVSVKWSELYPFADMQSENTQTKEEQKDFVDMFENIANGVVSRVNVVKEQISYYFDTGLYLRQELLETGAVIEHVSCWNLPESVKDNPYIFWNGKEGHISSCKKEVDVTNGAQSLSKFAHWTQEQGIGFLYVQYPEKMSCIDADSLPKGYKTYSDKNVDEFLQQIENNNVPYYDTRKELMPKNSDNMFELFFRTDHHWLPQTGLQVAGMLGERLQQTTDIEVDVEFLETKKYSMETYEGVFLGSYGREVTAGLIEPDDFYVITPEFETSLNVSVPNMNLVRDGEFENTLLNMGMLYLTPSYELSLYEVYCWGDRPLIEIENKKSINQSRVLIVKDSFSDVVVPYFALSVKEVSVIDLRYYTGSLKTYIDQYGPDCVIVAYNPGTIGEADDINYATHNSEWDFR